MIEKKTGLFRVDDAKIHDIQKRWQNKMFLKKHKFEKYA